jgi:uncharacterized damage-inducible protein DinB
MSSTETRQLLAHLEWADAVTWAAVLGSEATAADARIRELLIHGHETQWAYLQLWRQEPLNIPAAESFADLRDVMRWARRYHDERARFAAGLDEVALERAIVFPWAEQLAGRFGQVHPTSLRQSILQVALHSAYHRGQVNTRLRELGARPPLVDFVAWVWMGQPAAEWPAEA